MSDETIKKLSPPEPTEVEWTDFEVAVNAARDEINARNGNASRQEFAKWITGKELLAMKFPPTPWLIQGLLQEHCLGIIGADPKASKTWALLEMALSIAGSSKAFGEYLAPVAAPVALFMTEDSIPSLHNRLRSLCAGKGTTEAEADRATENLQIRSSTELDLMDLESVARFCANVAHLPVRPVLIGIDPLRNVHNGQENDSTDMNRVMRSLNHIRAICRCGVLVVHHSAKKGKDDARTGASRMRGSSAIDGARDALLSMEDTEKSDDGNEIANSVYVSLKAARAAPGFRLVLTIGDNDNGEAVSANWEAVRLAPREKPEKAPREPKESNPMKLVKAMLVFLNSRNKKLSGNWGASDISGLVKQFTDSQGGKKADCFEAARWLVDHKYLFEEVTTTGTKTTTTMRFNPSPEGHEVPE